MSAMRPFDGIMWGKFRLSGSQAMTKRRDGIPDVQLVFICSCFNEQPIVPKIYEL